MTACSSDRERVQNPPDQADADAGPWRRRGRQMRKFSCGMEATETGVFVCGETAESLSTFGLIQGDERGKIQTIQCAGGEWTCN